MNKLNLGRVKGDQGEPARVFVKSTVTAQVGQPASVTNSGTPQNVQLEFTIPQGPQGPQGDPGAPGKDGDSGLPDTDQVDVKLVINSQGQMEWVKDEDNRYELCEFYYFRHPTLKPGFMPAHGGLLENAATLYPEAWAYLQTEEGQKLCTTEAEWQAMTQAIWHTNADGTTVGWNGIGGAPFFAPNWDTGALRLPDTRGMYAEAAGFDSLGVGGVHGDGIVNFPGAFGAAWQNDPAFENGPFKHVHGERWTGTMRAIDNAPGKVTFDPARVVSVANKCNLSRMGRAGLRLLRRPQIDAS